MPPLTDFGLNPQNPQELLIATGERLLLSEDLGETFTELDVPAGISTVEWSKTGWSSVPQQSFLPAEVPQGVLPSSTTLFAISAQSLPLER